MLAARTDAAFDAAIAAVERRQPRPGSGGSRFGCQSRYAEAFRRSSRGGIECAGPICG